MATQFAALAEPAHTAGQPLSRVLVDIDNIQVDQRYRRPRRRELATRLRCNARSTDLVCRLGGEELGIIMPQSKPGGGLPGRIAPQSLHRPEPFQAPGETMLKATASVGGASHEVHAGLAVLFKHVDQALYSAKRSGRNRGVADAA